MTHGYSVIGPQRLRKTYFASGQVGQDGLVLDLEVVDNPEISVRDDRRD